MELENNRTDNVCICIMQSCSAVLEHESDFFKKKVSSPELMGLSQYNIAYKLLNKVPFYIAHTLNTYRISIRTSGTLLRTRVPEKIFCNLTNNI